MALSATATPVIASKLKNFVNNPLILNGTINRPNIYLATHRCNFKKKGGLSRSFGLEMFILLAYVVERRF